MLSSERNSEWKPVSWAAAVVASWLAVVRAPSSAVHRACSSGCDVLVVFPVVPHDRWRPWRESPEPDDFGWAARGAGHRFCGPAAC